MTPEIAKLLREPFPAEVVGKLPRVWCRPCTDAKKAGRTCDKHTKARCRVCANNITEAHLHLDYVGHAETTDRFLTADPEWTWEPVAFGPDGLPMLDRTGGLWIRLTIAGVTRLGYGHAGDKTGGDAIKESIGDALRNAGMRFGVALDLWGAKFKDGTEEHHDEPEAPQVTPEQARQNILANARTAIGQADEPSLAAIDARIGDYLKRDAITTDDAIELRRLLVKRLDEIHPAGEQAATGEVAE